MSVLIPCAGGGARVASKNNFEGRIGRIAGEILVGENVEFGRMIDGQKSDLIEINNFFERLHEPEAEHWMYQASRSLCERVGIIFLPKKIAINPHVLDRSRNIALAGADPVTNDASAEHVTHERITCAVPGEQRRAGTAAAIHFEQAVIFQTGNFD